MSVGPEAVVSLKFPPKDKVNHIALAQEAQASRAKITGFGLGILCWELFLRNKNTEDDEKLGRAVFRIAAPHYSQKYDIRHASLEQLEVSDHRRHLGMLVAVDAIVDAYHTLERIEINPFIEEALSTIPSIAPHVEGWLYERDTSSTVPVFALVRNLPSLRSRDVQPV